MGLRFRVLGCLVFGDQGLGALELLRKRVVSGFVVVCVA